MGDTASGAYRRVCSFAASADLVLATFRNALFHRHAGERESGGNVPRCLWARLYPESKSGEGLPGLFDFCRCHLLIHFRLLFDR
jgi:hypothetical protein